MNAKKMSRKALLIVVMSLILSACGTSEGATTPWTPAAVDAAVTQTLAALTNQPLVDANTAVALTVNAAIGNPTATLTAMSTPTRTPRPTSTPRPTNTAIPPTFTPVAGYNGPQPTPFKTVDPSQFEYFMQFSAGFTDVAMHGALIDRLDTLYFNVHRDFDGGNTLTTRTNDAYALWMGDYVNEDETQGGLLTPFLVDHDTGVFLVLPNTTVTIPRSVGNAYVHLENWTGETEPRTGTAALTKGNVEATSCVKNADIVPTIQSMLGQEPLFAQTDKVANKNPDARVRNGWYSTVHAKAGKTLVWVKSGEVSLGWAKVTEADGITLYVAKLNGELEVMYPFSGMDLCDQYPGYNTLPAVSASAAPAEASHCVPNSKIARIVNQNRQSDELYTALALLPSATHPDGTYGTKWNTFVITSGNAAGTNLLPIDWFNTDDGFRGLYFVTTDGTSTFEANSAVITLCTGGFSPADEFKTWWGK